VHCNSEEKLANIMTKPLKVDNFVRLRKELGVCKI
jgi:hypothetical protein